VGGHRRLTVLDVDPVRRSKHRACRGPESDGQTRRGAVVSSPAGPGDTIVRRWRGDSPDSCMPVDSHRAAAAPRTKPKEAILLLDVRSKNAELSGKLQTHVERRIHFALSRFSHRINRVSVRLADAERTRGGEEGSCSIEVCLRPTGRVRVQHRDKRIYAAVDQACDRAGQVMARELERGRRHDGTSLRAGRGRSCSRR
jgi:putative sigma-54 modulation protein